MGISGLVIIKKKDVVNSALWFGKLSTVVLYTVMILLFLFSNIPETTANGEILIYATVLLLSMVKYLRFHQKLLSKKET